MTESFECINFTPERPWRFCLGESQGLGDNVRGLVLAFARTRLTASRRLGIVPGRLIFMSISLETRRHSAAHLMAAAIQRLYSSAKFGVGPVVEHGFYYDVDLEQTLSADDLQKIEEMMATIVKENPSFVREEMAIDEAIGFFERMNQSYKVELLNDLKTKGTTSVKDVGEEFEPGNVTSVSVFHTGNFTDLCRGPHVEQAKEVGVYKLNKIAGAYWRGKDTNPQLQRIYGLCFATQEELDAHLKMLEEAEKRDHRKIGKDLNLFFIDDVVGKGLVLWLPKGTAMRNEIEKLAIEMEGAYGYDRVSTPHIAKEELYLTSGHLPYYKDSMYPPMVMDDGTYYMKAMNCPHHHVMYRHSPHSYRELPVRFAEYGTCYRNELSGALAGLLRVRALTMNDAHIYCRKDQIKSEFKLVMEMTMKYFKIFGLENYWFRLSKWSPDHKEKYIDQPENWEYCEGVLREVLQEMAVPFKEVEDEAAFYGPKVDVQFKSVIGREETMSTIQLDFLARERFGLSYTDQEGQKNPDVFVIHRAPLSTHERFMAFVIEHYAGNFPLWLAPVQVAVLSVADRFVENVHEIAAWLKQAGIRVEVDDSSESVGKKIRKAEQSKISVALVIGEKEASGQPFTVRVRGEAEQHTLDREQLLSFLKERIDKRS